MVVVSMNTLPDVNGLVVNQTNVPLYSRTLCISISPAIAASCCDAVRCFCLLQDGSAAQIL